ncbi:MAG: hypothetical protein AB7J63_01010 [Vicinamibacterales bacterium]
MSTRAEGFIRGRYATLLAMLAGAWCVVFAPATVTAQEPIPEPGRLTDMQLCELLPPSTEPDHVLYGGVPVPVGLSGCERVYPQGNGWSESISIVQYDGVTNLRSWLENYTNNVPGNSTHSTLFGDHTLEFAIEYGVAKFMVVRRCFNIDAPWTAHEGSRERTVARLAELDQRLASAPCPPAAPSAPTPTAVAAQPDTIVNIRDPSTGSWVPWLLVPGVGLVLWAAATLIRRKKPSSEGPATLAKGEKRDQPKVYDLDLRTQEDRTTVVCDGENVLWIYAQVRCNRPEVNTVALTTGLTFTAQGPDAQWVSLGVPQVREGFKAVPVRARPPSEGARLTTGKVTVTISGVLDGAPVSAPVMLDLQAYALEFF